MEGTTINSEPKASTSNDSVKYPLKQALLIAGIVIGIFIIGVLAGISTKNNETTDNDNVEQNSNQGDQGQDEDTDELNVQEQLEEEEEIEETSNTTAPSNTNQSYDLYFRKFPEASDDFGYVEAVTRSTSRSDVATFLVEQYIIGPTAAEKATGLVSAFTLDDGALSFETPSDCGGDDFEILIESQVAVVRFCRFVSSIDDAGAYVNVPLRATLEQFSTVDKVVVLDVENNCYNDASGINACMRNVNYNSLMDQTKYNEANTY